MNRNSQNIENLFKQAFQNVEIRPEKRVWRSIDKHLWLSNFKFYIEHLFKHEPISSNERVWRKINRKLWLQDYLSFNLSKFNIYYSSAAMLVLMMVLFSSVDNKNFSISEILPFTNEIEKIQKIEIPRFENTKLIVAKQKKSKVQIAEIKLVETIKPITKAFLIAENKIQKTEIVKISIQNNQSKNTIITKSVFYEKFELKKQQNSIKQKTQKWTFDVYTKLLEPYSANDITKQSENFRTEMIGLSIAYNVNNFIIETGVAFGKTQNYNIQNDSMLIVQNIQPQYFRIDSIKNSNNDSLLSTNFSNNNLNWKYDSSDSLKLDTTSIYEVLNSKDLYKTVEIPILFGYQLSQGNLSCAVKGGLISALYFKPTDYVKTYKDNSTEILNRNALVKADFSFTLAFGLEYKLNESFSLLTEPFYRKTLNSIFANESKYVQHYNSYGLKLGVRYTL